MMLLTQLLLIGIFLIVLIFLMKNLEWLLKELRSICQDESGYVKLIQLVFILLVLSSFLVLLVFSIVHEEKTSKLDVFLTVIVGLMGTIIGTFFSETTMESIKKDRDKKRRSLIEKTIKLKQLQQQLDEMSKKLS